ncbi:hypothetical protein ABZS98_35925 [Streptomyces avermitilis]
MPRFDSHAVFAGLLGAGQAGYKAALGWPPCAVQPGWQL